MSTRQEHVITVAQWQARRAQEQRENAALTWVATQTGRPAVTCTLEQLVERMAADMRREQLEAVLQLQDEIVARASWWSRPFLRLRYRWRRRRPVSPLGYEL